MSTSIYSIVFQSQNQARIQRCVRWCTSSAVVNSESPFVWGKKLMRGSWPIFSVPAEATSMMAAFKRSRGGCYYYTGNLPAWPFWVQVLNN